MILNRTRLLIAHGVDPAAFIERHGLDPCTWPCAECGVSRTTSIPCADGARFGLMSSKCEREDCPDAPYCCTMPELS